MAGKEPSIDRDRPWEKAGPAKEAWKAEGNRYTAVEVKALEASLKVTLPRRTRRTPHHG